MWNYQSKHKNIIINFDDIVNEEKIEYNKNYPYIPDDPFRMMIIGGSGSGKTNVLLNLLQYKHH